MVRFTDDQMVQFLQQGYVSVDCGLPPSFHESVRDQLTRIITSEGNWGNNMLPRVPELRDIFETPPVRGALESILGPNYQMHPHRHCHLNKPGTAAQRLHKDTTAYSGDEDIRHHRTRWAMAFYYPQEVTADMGPTSVLPGTHYHEEQSEAPEHAERVLLGSAGTVTIVHFDIWHRATANTSEKRRLMCKFLFYRTEEPRRPSWNHAGLTGFADSEDAMRSSLWRWHQGEARNGRPAEITSVEYSPHELVMKMQAMESDDEAIRLAAAYYLGNHGTAGMPYLLQILLSGSPKARRAASEGLAEVGVPACRDLLRHIEKPDPTLRALVADALGNIGAHEPRVIAGLARALEDPVSWVRRHAADALGTLGGHAASATGPLARLLSDEHAYVRINAATALGKIGPGAAEAVPALSRSLHDSDRYVQAFASIALRRVGTPEALELLLDRMETQRWCPVSSPETPY